MKLEIKELQELYDELMSASLTFSAYEESPVERAFKKCDALLQEHMRYDYLKKLQDRNDILEKSNESLLSANIDLARKKGKLEKDLDTAKKQVEYFTQSRDNWRSRAKHEVEEAEKKHQELKKELDDLLSRAHNAEDEADDLKNKCSVREEHIRELNARTNCLREEVEWYRKHYKEMGDELKATKERLDKANSDRVELQTDRDIWFQKNGEKQAEIAELTKKLEAREEEIQALKGDIDSDKYIQRLQDSVREIGYEQGQTDLWDMLQNVNDINSEEFDPECHSMCDIIGMDLEDFLNRYKEWQEDMRKYANAIAFGIWHGDATAEKVKDACDAFCDGLKAGLASEVKEATADVKIKENIPRNTWECTFTANIEVNKDLLEKVCGVVPVEEEHKLEYGDAVRVPWRDYDYMYIGPEDGCICLFNPKSHYVTYVSSTEKLTYQGCKFFICDEDDLRKIWNRKK